MGCNCHSQPVYPDPPSYPPEQCHQGQGAYIVHQVQPQQCTYPGVRVKVYKNCGGQWAHAQELHLNHPPQLGSHISLSDGQSYKIESLLLVESSPMGDLYEALVQSAIRPQAVPQLWMASAPQTSGCSSPKVSSGCGCSTPKASTSCGQSKCSCLENTKGSHTSCSPKCDPCSSSIPFPIYAIHGYPW